MDKIEKNKYWYYIEKYNVRMTEFEGVKETFCKGIKKPEFLMERFTEDDFKARPWILKWKKIKGRNPAYLPSLENLKEITFQEVLDLRDFGFFFDKDMNKFNKGYKNIAVS